MMYAPTSAAASAASASGNAMLRSRDLEVTTGSFPGSLDERDRVDAEVARAGDRAAGGEGRCNQGGEVAPNRLARRRPGDAADVDQERGPRDDVERGNGRVGRVEDREDQRSACVRRIVEALLDRPGVLSRLDRVPLVRRQSVRIARRAFDPVPERVRAGPLPAVDRRRRGLAAKIDQAD